MNPILPDWFSKRMGVLYGPAGTTWSDSIAGHLHWISTIWNLRLGEAYPLSFNYVCHAWDRSTGQELVVKTAPMSKYFRNEALMLAHYAGRSAARLIDSDLEHGVMLIERLDPGQRLLDGIADDDTATAIVAHIIKDCVHLTPAALPIPSAYEWAQVLTTIPTVAPGFDLIKPQHIQLALQIYEQDVQNHCTHALHGDLHHENILSTSRGWNIIDPQGVSGPRAYETTAYLRNHQRQLENHPDIVGLTRRPIDIFSRILDVDAVSIARLNFAAMVLSAWWCYEDGNINAYERSLIDAFAAVLDTYQ